MATQRNLGPSWGVVGGLLVTLGDRIGADGAVLAPRGGLLVHRGAVLERLGPPGRLLRDVSGVV